MATYDLIVIGAGAGLDVSAAAASEGWNVAVVEDGPFGGTCLNRGCIPSKLLIRSADVKELVDNAHLWGIDAEVKGVDWAAIVQAVSRDIDEEAAGMETANREADNLTVFKGRARFSGEKTLSIAGRQISAPNIVIAAGTRPRVPEIPGLDETPYLTSDNALRLEAQPRRLTILGGGSVAAELAHFFGALGTQVSIVQRGERLLSREDEDVSQAFTAVYADKFDLHLASTVTQVEHDEGGFHIRLARDGDEAELTSDALLVAQGRVPNTDLLDVAASGVDTDDRGFIRTDEFMATNVPGIWALGDIAGYYMLRHNANMEAAHVAHNLLSPRDRVAVDHHGMPHAVFASPQVGSTGLTEAEVRETGKHYHVGRAEYSEATYGTVLRDTTGFVKVLADPVTDEVLGCHIMGTDASILVQEPANLIRHRLPAEVISTSVYIHPALPEVVQRAFSSLHSHED